MVDTESPVSGISVCVASLEIAKANKAQNLTFSKKFYNVDVRTVLSNGPTTKRHKPIVVSVPAERLDHLSGAPILNTVFSH